MYTLRGNVFPRTTRSTVRFSCRLIKAFSKTIGITPFYAFIIKYWTNLPYWIKTISPTCSRSNYHITPFRDIFLKLRVHSMWQQTIEPIQISKKSLLLYLFIYIFNLKYYDPKKMTFLFSIIILLQLWRINPP